VNTALDDYKLGDKIPPKNGKNGYLTCQTCYHDTSKHSYTVRTMHDADGVAGRNVYCDIDNFFGLNRDQTELSLNNVQGVRPFTGTKSGMPAEAADSRKTKKGKN
jgi:hypothetical protein